MSDLAGLEGVEPSLEVLETSVLPLNDRPSKGILTAFSFFINNGRFNNEDYIVNENVERSLLNVSPYPAMKMSNPFFGFLMINSSIGFPSLGVASWYSLADTVALRDSLVISNVSTLVLAILGLGTSFWHMTATDCLGSSVLLKIALPVGLSKSDNLFV